MPPNIKDKAKIFIKLIIPFLLLILILQFPTPEDLSREGHMMFAILFFAAALFIIQPIPLGMAGLLILVMPIILKVAEPSKIFQSFGNPAVFFLIGAFIIAATIEKCGIHKKVALLFLKISGTNPRFFILTTMIAGASLSFIMPEHGVIILIVPILMYILVNIKIQQGKSNFAKGTMIGSAYGCSIGSLTTPLGGARNPLTIGFLNYQGIKIDFLKWIILSFPIVILSILAVWLLILLIFPTEFKDIKKVHKIVEDEVAKLPKFDAVSFRVIIALILCIIMWIFLPAYTHIDMSVISLIGGIILFIAGNMKWKEIETRIPWGIILLYGGAISLGINLAESGAAIWLSDKIFIVAKNSTLAMIIIIIFLTKLITEIMSNTAAVSILLPIAYGISQNTDLPPMLTCMLVGLSGGLAFMFLISTPGNLIAYSTGYFSQKDLLKIGVFANLATFAIILLITYTYWKWIGVW